MFTFDLFIAKQLVGRFLGEICVRTDVLFFNRGRSGDYQ